MIALGLPNMYSTSGIWFGIYPQESLSQPIRNMLSRCGWGWGCFLERKSQVSHQNSKLKEIPKWVTLGGMQFSG